MKNVFGKKDDLNLYNDKGVLVYEFYTNSNGDWYEYTRDDQGNPLTYRNCHCNWYEYTRDDQGNELTYKSSNGYWSERTYDDNGDLLTYKNSTSVSKTYDIPEYTMEQLTKIVGKEFKIKK